MRLDTRKDILEHLDSITWNSSGNPLVFPKTLYDMPSCLHDKFYGHIEKYTIDINKRIFKDVYNAIEYIKGLGFELYKHVLIPKVSAHEHSIEFIHEERKIYMIYAYDNYTHGYKCAIVFSNVKDNEKFIKDFVTTLHDDLFKPEDPPEKQKHLFYMVAQNQQGLYNIQVEFKELALKEDRFDLYYGKDFPYETLKKFVTDDTENLMMLHGSPGTGKSNFIKHLILSAKRPVLYIPPTMLGALSDPSFITYTMQNKNSILVIEDAEQVISKERNSATNNLLGLTDGFLKDALDLKIICTFNCDISNIDQALLRKGRLYYEYKFDKLSVKDALTLSDHLGLDADVTEDVTLAELFNLEKKVSQTNSFEKRVIGFGAQ